ncbi:glycosyltransferase family 4 protein [Arachidicoccus sp.]|uniref:glycosyltransferase family 4 protein n=1 Tax=Arachidicoccus sp. TaxID=1872624 RepID=UPI003D235897
MTNKNKIIAVGPTTQNNTVVNGQSMMFQLIIDAFKGKGLDFKVIDIGTSIFKNTDNKVSGKFSIIKAIDYIFIIGRLFFVLILNQNQTLYLTTAQSKVGFIRDSIIIRLAKFFKYKIVAHQFGANYGGFYSAQSENLKYKIRNILNKCNNIIVEGDYTKKQFKFLNNFETKVISLPNGLPEKIQNDSISAKSIQNSTKIKLFYLSNLIESKGYWDVLEAINILVNDFKFDIDGVFAGKFLASVDDDKFENIEVAKNAFFNYIDDHKLNNNVRYYKGLYGKDKALEFESAHFFLLPSYYINEGQPVSVLEALAYGCVPIVTNYRLIPMMVNIHNGVFVNPKSPNEIAESIKKLVLDSEKYEIMSKSGIDYYLNNFTPEIYTTKLIEILN